MSLTQNVKQNSFVKSWYQNSFVRSWYVAVSPGLPPLPAIMGMAATIMQKDINYELKWDKDQGTLWIIQDPDNSDVKVIARLVVDWVEYVPP